MDKKLCQTNSAATELPHAIDKKRYRIVRNFFIRTFVHLLFWDILLNRPSLRWLRTDPAPRWKKISRNYRELAVAMGGVLIKLGQFLSVRVDILPREVTSELSGLRDEIPAEHIDAIIAQIEEDFGAPVSDMFAWISPEPLGAASLGQAHRARLRKDQAEVVIKVLRPGIDILVETDLAAIRKALGWLKPYKQVSKRVCLDWLMTEFTSVTQAELDFTTEGNNAERFADDFADDSSVYVPSVYWDYSAPRTLTQENVSYIKISEMDKIAAAGINPAAIAKKLYTLYLRQVFETHFVHADPHPGNIFIKPLPTEDERENGKAMFTPQDEVPYHADRSFQIVFVDFGMVTEIPERLRLALREYVIGVGTRDAFRIVQSYVKAGTLLPGADTKRLEEAHEALLNQFWGANVSQMKGVVMAEAGTLMREYRDIIYAAPFQLQADMLFTVRAMAILSGVATQLNHEFDPWEEIIPFADRLAANELGLNWQQWFKEIVALGQIVYKLPKNMENVLTQAQRGKLKIQTSFAPESKKVLVRLEKAVNRLSWMLLAVVLFAVGMRIEGNDEKEIVAPVLLGLALLSFLWGLWSNRR
ncbi:AarF/UbiB family protein [Desulfogranum marinum]|uniref:ABC1 kinase family protein n=1 Tax=Desulfogranum marinum TaxID=453220 RepID=UPI0029C6BAF9|nr:AarF/UbiB family protein [Desulfogranum marinum]